MNLKRKEIVIYAIALMLVAAGYFNYLKFDVGSVETSSSIIEEDINKNLSDESKTEDNNKTDNTNRETENNDDKEKETASVSKETEENENQNKTNIGDAVLVSSIETTENIAKEENYYAETKLARNQMYAEMIKNYENLINNTHTSEVQKSIATEEIAKINNNKNAIMICENLILAKGFNNCVILINDESINVVVNIEDGLNTEKVSQIQNIISRELSVEIENIHISEK